MLCTSGTADCPTPHMVERTLCLLGARENCGTCPHSRFVVRFQLRVADQVVACPVWASEEDRKKRQDPVDYQAVQRDTCVRVKPYPFCEECPNGKAGAPARTTRKWFELEERQKRIERELDEEERDD